MITEMRYSPFEVKFTSLTAASLAVLREVEEGWYVEYKSAQTTATDIAKSVSSFANQYGGWLFIGIEEDESSRAGSFPGVSREGIRSMLDRIQQACARLISPSPEYEIRELLGPEPTIGLTEQSAVLAIKVQPGLRAPYVHNSGKVYRRQGNASEPRAENDRGNLDELWRRTERANDAVDRFIRNVIPRLSKPARRLPHIHLFLINNPLFLDHDGPHISHESFAGIMRSESAHRFGMAFETSCSMGGGYLARHVTTNALHANVPAFQYFHGGNSVLTLPFTAMDIEEGYVELNRFLEGYEEADEFCKLLEMSKCESGRLIDLTITLMSVFCAIEKHTSLLAEERVTKPMFAKVLAKGLWSSVPFLDDNAIVAGMKTHGIPLFQWRSLKFRARSGLEGLVQLPNADDDELEEDLRSPSQLAGLRAWFLCGGLMNALGLEFDVSLNALDNLTTIGRRSIEVQKRRIARQG